MEFGLFPLRSPLLGESRLLSLPPGTEMVHFPGFASRSLLYSEADTPILLGILLQDSEIPRSQPVCGSLGLIAAYHVLHRLPSPRHPPYALSSLTIKFAPLETPEGIPRGHFYGPFFTRRYLIVKDLSSRHMPEVKDSQPEPLTSRTPGIGGGKRVRTADPLLAKQVLSQLSYTPLDPLLVSAAAGTLVGGPR